MSFLKSKWFSFFVFKESIPTYIFIIFCLISSSYLGSQVPGLIQNLSVHFIDQSLFMSDLKKLAINFICYYGIRVIFGLSSNRLVRQLIHHARIKVFNTWVKKNEYMTELKANDQFPQGEVLARIMSDTEAIRELITSGTMSLFIDLFFVSSCLFGFIKIDQLLGLLLAILEVFLAFLLIWGSRYMRDVFTRVRTSQSLVSRTNANMVGGLREMYFNRHQNYASKRGEEVFDQFLKNQLEANFWDAGYYAIAESLFPLLLAFMAFIFPLHSTLAAASIFAMIDLIQRSINPIKEVSGKIANIQRAYSGIERMLQFINHFSEQNEFVTNDLIPMVESLEVNIQQFKYPSQSGQHSQFELKEIQFQAFIGQSIGIVGKSGCGKTTVMNILSSSIRPNHFAIKVNAGENSFTYDQDAHFERYKKLVSLVSQDSHIFTDSLFFNLSLKNEITKDLTTFYSQMKSKIPYLAKWGIELESDIKLNQLSLGQKQLIAALRACYLQKKIILFDEISSALDSDLELALRKAIEMLKEHSLTFIVAHRVETLINSDIILLMDNGRLIDSGSHFELFQRQNHYQEFIKELSHS